MDQIPPSATEYHRTPVYEADTIPDGLRKDHDTKPGVWGLITVIDGALDYTIAETGETRRLTPGSPGVVIPEQRHHVAPCGAVYFYVAFYREQPGGV